MVDDYLFVGEALANHLKDAMPALKGIYTNADLKDVAEARQITPAVHIVYVGDDIGETPKDRGTQGAIQVVTQNWAVVLAVYHADPGNSGQGARREIGPLISALIRSLVKYQPKGCTMPLARGSPIQPYYSNGFAYFPIVFKAQFVFKT